MQSNNHPAIRIPEAPSPRPLSRSDKYREIMLELDNAIHYDSRSGEVRVLVKDGHLAEQSDYAKQVLLEAKAKL